MYSYSYYNPFLHRNLYPPVNTATFEESIHSIQFLMKQGSILLNRLGDVPFAAKIMTAAQQGNKAKVDQLIKSIGLNVPVSTHYTPSGIVFSLTTGTGPHAPGSCCTLTVSMKWGF
ncbi:hypothetical protein ACQYAD_02290 [Neobacillus sp. SM06]|uniref:hypothetical protein n=1 Tax=Neobacillus sp. SM06 TaxID=3422492 RepID=UPI003D2E9BC3